MTTDTKTTTIETFALATEWDALFRAATSGTESEILDALAGLVEACPEAADFFAREAKTSTDKIHKALAVGRDAMSFGELDAEIWDEDSMAGISTSMIEADEIADMIDLLESAAQFGTLDLALEWLAEVDPKAHEVVCRTHGWGGQKEQDTKTIAADLGCTPEWARRLRERGLSKLAAALTMVGEL